MENRFKLRISRMFRASFGSCRTRNLSDIVEKAVFSPQQSHKNFHVIEPMSPRARPFPSICKPRCPESTEAINHDCIMIAPRDTLPRRKVSARYSPFLASATADGRMCPPASPLTPLNPFYVCKDFGFYEKKKSSVKDKKKKNKKKKTHVKSSKRGMYTATATLLSSSSHDSPDYGGWWFSSEDDEREDETETLFSSKSLSSDSSESRQRYSRRKRYSSRRRRTGSGRDSEMGVLPLEGTKVKDSFAVVKSSSDPYNDFRTSMVEMIVEKQIFAAKDLEQLLQCFLSLNSHMHHRIIVEVFTEIWEALFADWS